MTRGGIDFSGDAANGLKYAVKPGYSDFPVVFVSWYDSLRFANWLHNGQGNSGTEDGAYTLLGGTPTPSNGDSVARNSGAKWWLPSEDEWYKAAYHKNDGVTGNYWNYPTSTDAEPYSDQPPGTGAPNPANTANFFKHDFDANGYDNGFAVTGSPASVNSQNYLTEGGAYMSALGPYGTFDQGGNVWEWNEASFLMTARAIRGGAWTNSSGQLHANYRGVVPATLEFSDFGFRVATIPEPGTAWLTGWGIAAGLWRRRRRS